MKKTFSRTPTFSPNSSVNTVKQSNNKPPLNKSALKLQNNNNGPSVRNAAVQKPQNRIARPSVVQKQKSSYFKRLEQSESHSCGSLSLREVEELTHKFEALSRSIVEIARSQSPLGVRSLESLLTREISGTLGPALNHPKFSHGFIQATRTLLDNLVSDYESGKASTKLIRPDRNLILKADSSTTLCYRDKYFKELVINVLQSMCSNDVEEETDKESVRNISAESQERIQAIRTMIRAELGIGPEAFTELELRVADLRKSMSKSSIENDRDSREVDRVTADNLEYLKIPRRARDALRISCGGRQRSTSTETISDTQSKKEGPMESSHFNLLRGCKTNSLCDFKNSGIINTHDCGSDSCESKDNKAAMLREEMGRIVHDEFLRAQAKNKSLSERYSAEKCIDPLESYSRKFDIESAFEDDDDMINEEETRVFLEALKADIENRNRKEIISKENAFGADSMDGSVTDCLKVHSGMNKSSFLEQREVEDCSLAERQTGQVDVSIKRFHDNNNVQLCSPCLSVVDDIGNTDQNFNSCKIVNHKGENLEPTRLSTNTANMDKVKSQFWLKEVKLADEIIKEMQMEFDKFKLLTDDAFKELKDVANESKPSNEQMLQSAEVEQMSKYSVKDFANILNKICTHIHLLPITFDVRSPKFLEHRKAQAFDIMRVLERCFQIDEHSPLPTNYDPVFPLNDTKRLTLSIKSVLLAFSNLAEIIDQLPGEMKNMPISVLDPPQTLMKTLTVLFSADYFRGCFPPATTHNRKQKDDDYNYKKLDVVKSLHYLSTERPKPENSRKQIKSNNEISSDITVENPKYSNWFGNSNFKSANSLGCSSSNITVQNLSDMFLHISTLLNDVPESLKSKKFLTLSPPDSLRQAVSILYCSKDAEFLTTYAKKASFASLTLQNTSDFFLTLSSTFYNVPERVRHLVLKDLDPPKSLTKAISLLRSLSNSTLQECLTQEMDMVPEKVEEQEHFFDAVGSLEEL